MDFANPTLDGLHVGDSIFHLSEEKGCGVNFLSKETT